MERTNEQLLASYEVERELSFMNIEGQGELSVQRNKTEIGPDGQPFTGLRAKITHHSNIFGIRIYGVVHKLCWGSYNDNLACLLVVRFRFAPGSGLFRLRKAVISFRFENYPASEGLASAQTYPVVQIFSPKHIFGIPTSVEHEHFWSATAQCSVSSGPIDVGPEAQLSRTTRFQTEAALEIAGMDELDEDKELPSKVIFEVDENEKVAKGIPRELFFGTVVQCDGPMQAEIDTSIRDKTAWPWKSDDPIILRPGISYGQIPANLPTKFEQLKDDDWKILVPYQEEKKSVVQGRPR